MKLLQILRRAASWLTNFVGTIALIVVINVLDIAVTYGVTCLFWYGITFCFGKSFSFKTAAGVTLCLMLLEYFLPKPKDAQAGKNIHHSTRH